MYGKGYLFGIGLAVILWLLIRQVDKRYYQRKHALIQQRLNTKRLQKKQKIKVPEEPTPK